MQVRRKNFFFSRQNIIGEQLCLHIIESQTVNGLGKALAGLPLFPEQMPLLCQ